MRTKNVEDIYPLSPMQQGLLFHAQATPESAMYFVQWTCTLQGKLDLAAYQRAWQTIVDHHPSLRALFIWEHLDQPLQIVRSRVGVPWTYEDWRAVAPAEQHQRLDQWLQADRQRGFDLSHAPLMRVSLLRMAEETHQLIWSFHHVLLDGWSIRLLLQDVFRYYAAFCRGQDVQLEPSRPYRDYIAWLQAQDLAQAEAFWRDKLSGLSTLTPLVIEQSRATTAEVEHYGEQQITLSTITTSALQVFAREHQLTLSTIVQGCWAILLSCYSGQQDIVFGSTVAGRPPELIGVEQMIGLFINTLPVRAQVAHDAAVLGWLKELQDQQSEARQYEHSSLAQIQRWSEIGAGERLFNSLLSFENYPGNAFAADTGGLTISNARAIERTNYPLSVSITVGAELAVKFIYDVDRFDHGPIRRMGGHLQTLLEQIVAAPGQRIADLWILTEAERQQMLVEWNATYQQYPTERCVHGLVEDQAARRPDAVAVVAGGQQLTYSALNQRANQLAHYLRKLGVGPEMLVGIYVERSPELLIGLLAILKAGAAYVPFDSAYPRERLRFMLQDLQAPVLLTQHYLLDQLPDHPAHLICLDADWPRIAEEETHNPDVEVLPENLAYIIYTSGSTGQPKGVQIFHRALLNLVFWHLHSYAVTSDDRATQLASLGFDASVWELWPYLAAGASIYLSDAETRIAPQLLRDWLVANGITLTFLPTPLAEALLDEVWPADVPLRAILTGGDQLRVYPDPRLPFKLVNHYGPTENTVVASAGLVSQQTATTSLPTIGRPIANTEIYLLDRYLRAVPVGIPGELYIGGSSLARGYLNQPALTAERFIAHPFSQTPGARLYKTGDLARFLPDGNLEFLGRSDHQVKIQGFRIELGEIEAALRMHPAVSDTIIVVRERDPLPNRRHTDPPRRAREQRPRQSEKYLVAYIIPDPDLHVLAYDVRDFLYQTLPEYMVPAFYVQLKSWPLLPSGKIDRRALPAPPITQPNQERAIVAPQTALEQTIAQVWQAILGVERVGRHDNFFDLGGHSLLMFQVCTKLNEQSGHNVSLIELFTYPTVSSLAHFLSRRDQPQRARGDDESGAGSQTGRDRLRQQFRRRSSDQ